ncbi:DUF2157 domain-containing protein [Rhizobiaceae bacterium n13]|uniref:DUF2157 domain-containing protein n=1 Tax=Ferirhizobium litorale TaxID=2927786 RepID=A0AAE3U2L1_9HYPH|nr:DUF2157 domain-containing protein [Fererhizobium litorale]MDI7863934.1 DUF2157 domain-containing protein [Fererhizobium litorale]MDI7924234.1 DUF2157 domain-containing protein [Fererhizobium litorale]
MYRGRLERDFRTWVEKGLLDERTAAAMLDELDGRESSFNLGRVLMIIAALMVSAAILLVVASNWQEIPRLARVVGLVALIWVFHLGAAICIMRDASRLAAAFLVAGTMTFGAAVSLVSQMYNISGDTLSFMALWFGAACVTAALFRSPASTVVAGFLSWVFFGLYLGEFDGRWDALWAWGAPMMAVVTLGLVYVTKASQARHLAYLLLIGWITWIYFVREDTTTATAIAVVGLVGFLTAALPASPAFNLARAAGPAPAFYTFLLGSIGLGLLHLEFDDAAGRLAIGIVTMAAAVAAIALAGRDNGAVRYLGYAVLALEILYLSFETVGTILGTSGFFLLSGLIVAALAWLVIRLERRFSGRNGVEA